MKLKKIHPKSKIFFNPSYVVRVCIPDTMSDNEFFRYIKKSLSFSGTWGYSYLRYDECLVRYICFNHESDALTFTLGLKSEYQFVKIWPAMTFTIHEMVDS